MLCTVTAISPDDRRSSIDVEARSLNYAAIEYYRAVGNSQGLIVPEPQTISGVEANGTLHWTCWGRVLKWTAKAAERSIGQIAAKKPGLTIENIP